MDSVCCVDLGTTGIKAALCDPEGRLVARVSAAADPGFEFDADETRDRTFGLVRELIAAAAPGAADSIVALAIASQRATIVPVGESGRAAGPAISWQHTRGGAAEALSGRFGERLRAVAGLPPSALWSVAKMSWLREERPDIWDRTRRVVLLHDWVLAGFGVPDFVTDHANASLTGLWDLRARDWSEELLGLAGFGRSLLPTAVPSGAVVGAVGARAAARTGLRPGTLLVAGAGDQQCASLGAGVVDPGDAGICLGTAAVVSCPVTRPPDAVASGVFCTAHAAPNRWVLEGIHNTFGSALRWAVDALGFSDAAAMEQRAAASESSGVFFVPHLAGAGSPDFAADARGAFMGLTLGVGRDAMARAAYEGVALETRRILDALEAGGPLRRLVASGGAARCGLLAQVLSDLTGRRLLVQEEADATLLGAALIAWAGAGRFTEPAAGARTWAARSLGDPVEPVLGAAERDALFAAYLGHVRALRRPVGHPGGIP